MLSVQESIFYIKKRKALTSRMVNQPNDYKVFRNRAFATMATPIATIAVKTGIIPCDGYEMLVAKMTVTPTTAAVMSTADTTHL